MDGRSIFTKVDPGGSLDSARELKIHEQTIPPGTHNLQMTMVLRGKGYQIFSYLRTYQFNVQSSYSFRVEDGLLKVGYEGYDDSFDERFGHLFHEAQWSHYRLRIEYRFVGDQTPGAPGWAVRNSGVMLHGQDPATMALDQDFPVSIEAQLLGGLGAGPRSTANLCTPATHVEMDGQLVRPVPIHLSAGS